MKEGLLEKYKQYSLMAFVSILLISYAGFMALFVRSPHVSDTPVYLYIIIICSGLLTFIKAVKLFSRIKVNNTLFAIFVFIFSFGLRILWLLIADPVPFSDYKLYHDYASNISTGMFYPQDNTCLIFPHRFGYSFFLGLIYSVFGSSIRVGAISNVIISSVTCVIIFSIGTNIFDRKAGLVSSILFALWPAQIMFSSVIASEHSFLLFFLAAIAVFLIVVKNPSMQKYNKYILMFSIGSITALARTIRPMAILLLFVFAVYFLLSSINLKKSIIENVKLFIIIISGYMLAILILNTSISSMTGIPIRSSPGYSLLVGTNYSSSGMYNNYDASITAKHNYDFDEVHRECLKTAVYRITSQPLKFLSLIEDKYLVMWGDDTYGSSWSLAMSDSSNTRNKVYKFKRIFNSISQAFYILILIFIAAGLSFLLKKKNMSASVTIIVFLVHVGAYVFLEVQPRYHYPAIACLLPIAAYGIIKLSQAKIQIGKYL